MTDVASIAAQTIGQIGLFLGAETSGWSIAQFEAAAKFARAHNIDTLYVKCADGANKWYGGNFAPIRTAILAQGVGCVFYIYSYGNKFGALSEEIAILTTLMTQYGCAMADCEVEWNGQVGWAQTMNAALRPVKGSFFVSTWGDPNLQNWMGVVSALAPCVNAFLPQQYTNYLASQSGQFSGLVYFPTYDLANEFNSPNDPLAAAKSAKISGVKAISMWEYVTATTNPALVDEIVAVYKPKTPPPPVVIPPRPNKFAAQQLLDEWNSTAHLFGGKAPAYTTGIASFWVSLALTTKRLGPPVSAEYGSVDWGGAPIRVQNFAGGRVEDKNGVYTAWDSRGRI